MMEAQKQTGKHREVKEGKTYEHRVFEIKEVNLLQSDWDFLYNEIMNDDWECSNENGHYNSDEGYHYIDCQMVAERMIEYIDEIKDDYDETLESKNTKFQSDYKRILKLLEDNLGFDIWYKHKNFV